MDPLKNGYHKESDGQLKPTMTDALPAPKAIIEMVSCHCKTDCRLLLPDVLAEQRIYPAPSFASAAVSVRMMRTHSTRTKLIMTMMVKIIKDSLVV